MTVFPIRAVIDLLFFRHHEAFRRAAAAFGNHHARRGGLLEHTSQMLRCAVALAPLYPEVTPDLLYAGVILHDFGKIVETDYPERGFEAQHRCAGELLGHIAIELQMIQRAWEEMHGMQYQTLLTHLLHLILSHHGQNEWGSPVEPKTPEAVLLHQIDMIDSRIEMLRGMVQAGEEKGGLVKAKWPMKGYVALPFSALKNEAAEGEVAK